MEKKRKRKKKQAIQKLDSRQYGVQQRGIQE